MAVISETELQRRLRNLENATGSSTVGNVSGDDPLDGDYNEGDTWFNATTGNLWIFSGGVWQIAPEKLYIRYADSVVNIGLNNTVSSQSDITGFSIEAFLTDGSQKPWRGLWWGAGVASTDSTDYEWFDVTDLSNNQLERYWANASARLTEIGTPDRPGIGVTWTLVGAGGIPSGAYWVAERFQAGGLWTPWSLYPVQADNTGIPFIRYTKSGFNMPVLGSATWITDVIEAASIQTGLVFSNQKELGYGTVVVIEYDNGKVAGQYIRQSGVDVWVAPSQLIDGDVIVDGSLTADHLQANTIGASKLIITGVDSVTYTTVGADASGSAATAQSTAAADATAKANLAQVTASAYADGIVTAEEARAIADATAKANLAQVTASAYADGIVTVEEARAIADATAKANAAETAANLATAQELAANVYSSGTTTIDGGKITTNTILAGSIIAGTITGWTINGNTIIGGTITGGAISGGTININSGAFEVNGSGVCWVRQGIFGGVGSFASTSGYTGLYSQNTSTGIALWGQATGGTGGGNHGLRGQNTVGGSSGLVGPANAFDFYAESGGGYGPFTGSHDALTSLTSSSINGDIMVDGVNVCRSGLSNTIFEVVPSSTPNQKGAIGIYAGFQGLLADQYEPAAFVASRDEDGVPNLMPEWDSAKDIYNLVKVNALGEGQINIIGEGGDLVAGDLIVTSSTTGKGMKQADDIVRSNTVAKVREAVTFTTPTEERQVACVYLCG